MSVRNSFERNSRYLFNFIPRATKMGIKFKNKSEEERYFKIVSKILKIDIMNQIQIDSTLN